MIRSIAFTSSVEIAAPARLTPAMITPVVPGSKLEPPDLALVPGSLVIGAGTVNVSVSMPVIDPTTTFTFLAAHAIIAPATDPANGNGDSLVAGVKAATPGFFGLTYEKIGAVVNGPPLPFEFKEIPPGSYILSVVQDKDSDGDTTPLPGPTDVTGGPVADTAASVVDVPAVIVPVDPTPIAVVADPVVVAVDPTVLAPVATPTA